MVGVAIPNLQTGSSYPIANLLKDVEKSKYINEKTYWSHKLLI
jgi:hypothetical protein